MYPISHAVTALAIKRRFPEVGLLPLLMSVQLVELMWVALSFSGAEHAKVTAKGVHLDFLPYSHSLFTSAGLALFVWLGFGVIAGRLRVGAALALAVVSHIVLDIAQHEPDITLLPWDWGPKLGTGLSQDPSLDLLVELMYGLVCWYVFRGTWPLLIAIVVLNVLDIPLMFHQSENAELLLRRPHLLPMAVLVQILISGAVVWGLACRASIRMRMQTQRRR